MIFFREIPICVNIQLSPSLRRVFFFNLSVGFSKAVDSLTGMSVSLVEIDRCLDTLKSQVQSKVYGPFDSLNEGFCVLMDELKEMVDVQCAHDDVNLEAISIVEHRNFGLCWESRRLPHVMVYSQLHYLEDINHLGVPDLLCIKMKWEIRRNHSCDFLKTGVEILKSIGKLQSRRLLSQIAEIAEQKKATDFVGCEIHYLNGNYKLLLEK